LRCPLVCSRLKKRGKTSDEDILTSKVFGILSKIDKTLVLGQILKEVGVIIPCDELVEAEITLWEDYNGTVPDVSIETTSNLVFIECKLNSPISIEQLKREYNEGMKFGKNFRLLCLTKDYVEPSEIKSLKSSFPEIVWMNWQSINAQLRSPNLGSLDDISYGLIQDLADLLGSQGLRGFAGFKKIS